ncbi:hypothetical protein BH10BAC1_BH10BAC1_14910 [soil metagenome]
MENSLNSKIHTRINDWMTKLDHYPLQLSLGKMEVKDEYVKQKKELHDYLHEYIQSAEHFKNVAEEKASVIKKSLGELKTAFEKEEEATEKTIQEHKNSIRTLLNKSAF